MKKSEKPSNGAFGGKTSILCLLAATPFLFLATRALAVPYGVNLLVNGNAESGPASTGGPVANIPGWTVTGGATVVTYGAPGGFPSSGDVGPPDRLNAFFAGGNTAASSFTQSIDVSANGSDIDTGQAVCDIEAWLGGYLKDDDSATFVVNFMQDASTDLGGSTSLTATSTDRGMVTSLISRSRTVAVPIKTRLIKVTLSMTRASNGGDYNDGYADSLSVQLRKPMVVKTTHDGGPDSLRIAVQQGSIITFDNALFARFLGPQVITLATALPDLRKDVTIIGPGADLLTVQRSGASGTPKFRIFTVTNGLQDGPIATISGLTIANGDVSPLEDGGGIGVFRGGLTLSDCRVVNNSGAFGGGIFFQQGGSGIAARDTPLIVARCTIAANLAATNAQRSFAAGAGIYLLDADTIIDRCVMSGNSAPSGSGGALYVSGSVIDLRACTISGNSAKLAGAIFNVGSGSGVSSADLKDCTVADNGSGGLRNDNANGTTPSFTFTNTIISGPSPILSVSDATVASNFVSDGFNIVSDTVVGFVNPKATDQVADPKLGPLQDNGGPTFTRALLPGSPAIDKGNSNFAIDQRGAPRPYDDPNSPNGSGNQGDVGAFESQVPPVVLTNISTRLRVGTGDNALIAGFIVTGYQQKKVIVRAIGPSLPFADKLADPILELHDSSGALLEVNDNWMDSPNKQAIIDSTIPPGNPLESAIVRTLAPGAYTAVVRGVNNGTGTAVVEAYDLDRSADSKLANISTRGFVQTGDNVLFAGVIILGQIGQKVIIRALGPSVPVPGAMADPILELRDANGGLLESNDNWVDSPNKQAIIDSTIPPSNNLESAIVRTLSPANYTAIVRGANNSTGIAVVEVYALQ
jgi:hypothetical protein